jgi:hypothetical protein
MKRTHHHHHYLHWMVLMAWALRVAENHWEGGEESLKAVQYLSNHAKKWLHDVQLRFLLDH